MQVSLYSASSISSSLTDNEKQLTKQQGLQEHGLQEHGLQEHSSVSLNQRASSQNLDIHVLLNTGDRADTMAIFDHLLQEAYSKISEEFELSPQLAQKMSEVPGYSDTGLLTAQKASQNILGFIERRLMLDVAEGANEDELASRLQAGLEGFEKGFSDAKKQLESLVLFTPEIEDDIDQTYHLVTSGIESLKDKYLQSPEKKASDPINTTQSVNTNPSANTVPSINTSLQATMLDQQFDSSNHLFAQSNRFDFNLKTQEGDTVTIRASAQEAILGKGYTQSAQFSLEIEGELNEEELKAINNLLEQVNKLADTFFSGDLDEAFQQALDVGYDSREIAQFSVTLAHSEIQKYPQNEDASNSLLTQNLRPIGEFTNQLLAAFQLASNFSEPLQLLRELTEHIDSSKPTQDADNNSYSNTRFTHFVATILDSEPK